MPNDPVVFLDVKNLVKDLSDISDLSLDQITANVLDDIGKTVTAKAKELAPVDTGALKNSITYKVEGDELIIEVGADYGMYQEFGTASRGEFPGQPYEIKPKSGKYLKFKYKGRWVYTKKVVHPGVKPKPYLRPGVILGLGDLYKKLSERGQAMILKGPRSTL